MKKLVLLFTILFCWGCSPSTDNIGDLSIIPYPNEIEVKSNQFLTLGNEVSIRTPPSLHQKRYYNTFQID